MTIISLFLRELEEETLTARKMLSRIPTDKLDWQPHPKSMVLRSLAVHIADLPNWIALAFNTDELDFAASPYSPPAVNSIEDILEIFEKSLVDGRSQLMEENAPRLGEQWTLRHADTVLWQADRWGMVRMALSQIIHHRAQLGVYLRLLDVPIPGSYGPSADDQSF